MTPMLLQTIEQIGREKNIPPNLIIEAVEEAMAVASKKYYRTEEELKATLNRETGEVAVYAVKSVVDEVEDELYEVTAAQAHEYDADATVGDLIHIPKETAELGRIAAQAAKQVIFQKVRDAERENIFDEFEERCGELLTGLVKRFERGDMIVDLGRTEGLLPRREQSRAEHYNIGDRIRIVIIDVLKVARGPQVVVSRVNPELLMRLFEMEVPEIYDATVSIKGAVREGGDRAKVAVHSTAADVDPVGACVGMRGSRVQSIIRELRGEKIDIVQWSPELQQYAINALKPARVNRVAVIDSDDRHLEVVVDEDQLSLAIGKRGQNVRLAGKLLDAKIDIKSEDDKKREVELALMQMAAREQGVDTLAGVDDETAAALVAAGIKTVGDVIDTDAESLGAIDGVDAAEETLAAARKILAAAVPAPPEPEPEPETAAEAADAATVTGDADTEAAADDADVATAADDADVATAAGDADGDAAADDSDAATDAGDADAEAATDDSDAATATGDADAEAAAGAADAATAAGDADGDAAAADTDADAATATAEADTEADTDDSDAAAAADDTDADAATDDADADTATGDADADAATDSDDEDVVAAST